jgi:hypothetical protein
VFVFAAAWGRGQIHTCIRAARWRKAPGGALSHGEQVHVDLLSVQLTSATVTQPQIHAVGLLLDLSVDHSQYMDV